MRRKLRLVSTVVSGRLLAARAEGATRRYQHHRRAVPSARLRARANSRNAGDSRVAVRHWIALRVDPLDLASGSVGSPALARFRASATMRAAINVYLLCPLMVRTVEMGHTHASGSSFSYQIAFIPPNTIDMTCDVCLFGVCVLRLGVNLAQSTSRGVGPKSLASMGPVADFVRN
jgi:hypothetical protein